MLSYNSPKNYFAKSVFFFKITEDFIKTGYYFLEKCPVFYVNETTRFLYFFLRKTSELFRFLKASQNNIYTFFMQVNIKENYIKCLYWFLVSTFSHSGSLRSVKQLLKKFVVEQTPRNPRKCTKQWFLLMNEWSLVFAKTSGWISFIKIAIEDYLPVEKISTIRSSILSFAQKIQVRHCNEATTKESPKKSQEPKPSVVLSITWRFDSNIWIIAASHSYRFTDEKIFWFTLAGRTTFLSFTTQIYILWTLESYDSTQRVYSATPSPNQNCPETAGFQNASGWIDGKALQKKTNEFDVVATGMKSLKEISAPSLGSTVIGKLILSVAILNNLLRICAGCGTSKQDTKTYCQQISWKFSLVNFVEHGSRTTTWFVRWKHIKFF